MWGCGTIAALFFLPRLTLFIVWLATNWFDRAYDSTIWPLLGFFFMPYTTAAFMGAMLHVGDVSGGWLVAVIIAVFFDLGGSGLSIKWRRS